jgi:hypothetical protein
MISLAIPSFSSSSSSHSSSSDSDRGGASGQHQQCIIIAASSLYSSLTIYSSRAYSLLRCYTYMDPRIFFCSPLWEQQHHQQEAEAAALTLNNFQQEAEAAGPPSPKMEAQQSQDY